jgi:hypothetical protein
MVHQFYALMVTVKRLLIPFRSLNPATGRPLGSGFKELSFEA